MDLASVQVIVHGRVQGIGFRAFVKIQAKALKLNGYVRNQPDETAVEIEAEGDRSKLEKMISILRVGPPMARITGVEVIWSEFTGCYTDFTTRH